MKEYIYDEERYGGENIRSKNEESQQIEVTIKSEILNKMKKITLVASLVLFSLGSFAQDTTQNVETTMSKKYANHPVEEVAANRTKQLTKRLKLSEEQSLKVKEVLFQSITDRRAVKQNLTKTSSEVKKARIEELKLEKAKKLASIFTPDQLTTYLQYFERQSKIKEKK